VADEKVARLEHPLEDLPSGAAVVFTVGPRLSLQPPSTKQVEDELEAYLRGSDPVRIAASGVVAAQGGVEGEHRGVAHQDTLDPLQPLDGGLAGAEGRAPYGVGDDLLDEGDCRSADAFGEGLLAIGAGLPAFARIEEKADFEGKAAEGAAAREHAGDQCLDQHHGGELGCLALEEAD